MRAHPLAGIIPRMIDELWWIHVIHRAQIVDIDFVRVQLGPRITTLGAVRKYVRGGFRRGLTLNPLYSESLISRQLPDSDRVPALYAYLVSDPTTVQVSPAWEVRPHEHAGDTAADDPGGPLGRVWRQAKRDGQMELGYGDHRILASWTQIRQVTTRAARAAVDASGEVDFRRSGTAENTLIWSLSSKETDAGASVRQAVRISRQIEARLDFALTSPSPSVLVDAALASLSTPSGGVLASFETDSATLVKRLCAETRTGVVVVRGPSAELDDRTAAALVRSARTRRVAPVWLSTDGSIRSAGMIAHGDGFISLLSGHPVEDARRLGDRIDVAWIDSATFASPADESARVDSDQTLLQYSVLAPPGPKGALPVLPWIARSTKQPAPSIDATLLPSGLRLRPSRSGPPIERIDRRTVLTPAGDDVPRLRWAIKTAAPAGSSGEAWGDTHFARALAAALGRLGQDAAVDAYPARHRASASLDDVTVTLRGPRRIDPPPFGRSVLWVISHPEEITSEELSGFGRVYAASDMWAASASARFQREIIPLLQCTDATRFHPTGAIRTDEIVFVGTARGIARPSVVEPIKAGIPVKVYGPDWRGYIPAANIAAVGIANNDLPARYESAGVSLNDHWPSMKREGFVSNRPYDIVAAGGRVISDDVTGIHEIFEGAVLTYESVPELITMLSGTPSAAFPPDTEMDRISELIRTRDSFDARARTLLDGVLDDRAGL